MTRTSVPDQPSHDSPRVVRVRTPGDIVASLPALIGYHPRDSVVLVVLGGERRRVRLTMRIDRPDGGRPGSTVWRRLAEAFRTGVARVDGQEAVLVVVDGSAADADLARRAVDRMLVDYGITLEDVLVVSEGRYRSIVCDDPGCCPPEGRPVPASSAVTAAAISEGKVICGSRDELGREVEAPSGARLDRAERVVRLLALSLPHGSLDVSLAAVEDELDRACAAARRGDLPLNQAVRLALMVGAGTVRDRTYLHLVRTGPRQHRQVWASVCRQVPPHCSAVPLALTALCAYLTGDGAVANVVLERARAVDCTHPTVALVDDIVAVAIPPSDVVGTLEQCMSDGR